MRSDGDELVLKLGHLPFLVGQFAVTDEAGQRDGGQAQRYQGVNQDIEVVAGGRRIDTDHRDGLAGSRVNDRRKCRQPDAPPVARRPLDNRFA